MTTHRQVHVVGGFTIDAIIRADGSFATGQLGGNALWASAGMAALAGGSPVAHAVVGEDYPDDALDDIAAHGVDVTAVRRNTANRTARVTFAYRSDGSRTQPAPAAEVALLPSTVHSAFGDTTRDAELTAASVPTAADIRQVAESGETSWHLGLLPSLRFAELVQALREGGAEYVQADCPARFELRRDGEAVLAENLRAVDVFLPSTSDTDVFAPGVEHDVLVDRFHDYGAPVVVLKRGELGVYVSDRRTGERWSIPAFPLDEHVDATGAGDVFCGTFAHFYTNGMSLRDAAVAASVRASYAPQVSTPLDLRAPESDDLVARTAYIQNGVTSR